MTVRQVYYQLVSRGAIAKTEREYKSTVVRLLTAMRREGALSFDWIADSTRWMRKPRTYGSLNRMLEYSARTYRRSLWDDQNAYIEIWLEKEALAGVLYRVTDEWDVPLMVTRGYPSLSFLHSAAEVIAAVDKPTHLYYFGDHDPSGLDISRAVEDGIGEMLDNKLTAHHESPVLASFNSFDAIFGGDRFTFERVAVTQEQIAELDLPTRPTKQTDSRSASFQGESVELDAIPPTTLRQMVTDCIERHIDADALSKTRRIEVLERETLEQFAEHLNGEASGE